MGISVKKQAQGKRRRTLIAAAAGGIVVLTAAMLLIAWSAGWLGGTPPNPNVLTVAKSGGAQFTTLTAALAQVTRPDMAIRVLDEGPYQEFLYIKNPELWAGLTIESARGAKWIAPAENTWGAVMIEGVPRVTIRGFHFENQRANGTLVYIAGASDAVRLERCRFSSEHPLSTGISLGLLNAPEAQPVTIGANTFDGVAIGIDAIGLYLDSKLPKPLHGAVICDNHFRANMVGILMAGEVADVRIAGNRFTEFVETAIRVDDLSEQSDQILIVNNTFHGQGRCLQIAGQPGIGRQFWLRNNLTLPTSGLDFAFLGTDRKLLADFVIDHNWRKTKPPAEASPEFQQAILAPNDTFVDQIAGLPLDPALPDYLRPTAASPLSTSGAGGDLPSYVGALPPAGAPTWDWRTTWNSPRASLPADPNVLTVSQDGTGQYRLPSEALEDVTHPNMTILIRDAGHYDDALLITRPAQQAGLKIQSPHGATLRRKADGSLSGNALLHIQGVEQVRVSGLRFSVEKANTIAVLVIGPCPGLVLEDLKVEVGRNLTKTAGVSIEAMEVGPEHSPVVVQRCTFTGGYSGVQITGKNFETHQPMPVAGVCVRDCSISNCQVGLIVAGRVDRLLACGNRIWNCQTGGLALFDVFARSKQLALVNNSVVGSGACLAVVNTPQEVQDVELVNNLLLATAGPDVYLENSACNLSDWRKHHNWRQLPPAAKSALAAAGDRVGPADTVLSLRPSDPDFLRPKAESPLAKDGAGGDLPTFIGAVPPAGSAAWDWQAAWNSRHPPPITVSKEAARGGQHRTIGEAVRKAKRGMTVLILDDAEYRESPLSITNAEKHAGLTIESPRHATLETNEAENALIDIAGVPNVTIRGLRLRAGGAKQTLVMVRDSAPGLLLDGLEMIPGAGTDFDGVYFYAVNGDGPPAVVQNCTIRRGKIGLAVAGYKARVQPAFAPAGRVVLRHNRILGTKECGIAVSYEVSAIHIVGNQICGPMRYAGLQFENLKNAADLLVANNTFFQCGPAFRLWDADVTGERIELANNLTLAAPPGDWLFADSGGTTDKLRGPGDGSLVPMRWTVRNNWRENPQPLPDPSVAKAWIPPSATDRGLDQIEGLSRDSEDPDFARPATDSPLVAGGAGGDLPEYVGAKPPQGATTWDWNQTWQRRFPTETKQP